MECQTERKAGFLEDDMEFRLERSCSGTLKSLTRVVFGDWFSLWEVNNIYRRQTRRFSQVEELPQELP